MSLTRISFSLALAAALGVPASAAAQTAIWRTPGETPRYTAARELPVSYYEARRTAYERGYREGLRRGEQDARRGNRFGYHDVRDFQRADKGYHRSFGDRERYRQVFRDGFAEGYSEGYSRAAGYGRNTRGRGPYVQGGYGSYGGGPYGGRAAYASPAFDNGLREGYEKGLDDARRNRPFDPVRHSWYRSGDRHYRSEYGSRDQYKDLYRRGFQQGYERGYQEARYRW